MWHGDNEVMWHEDNEVMWHGDNGIIIWSQWIMAWRNGIWHDGIELWGWL